MRRAAAVAVEQEMRARTQEMRAKVVEAEAQVPLAMAEAFRTGNLGIMDYMRMKNIEADTANAWRHRRTGTSARRFVMMLAAIDSNLLFYVIAAVIGLISWLTKKDEKGSGEHTPTPRFPRPKPTGQGQQKPEADRMREFLDALGIPADQRPPVAKPRTPPAAPRAAVAEDLRGKAAPASRSADAPAPWVTPPTRTQSPPPPLPRSVVIGRERPPVASPRAPVLSAGKR